MNIYTLLTDIQYAQSQYLWLLPITVLIIIVIWYRACWRMRIAKRIPGRLLRHFSVSKQYLVALLLTIASVGLQVALLQPYLPLAKEVITQEGRDIIIGLDVSASMRAQDMNASRLDCAKQKIKELLSRLPCERIGLLLFSGSAVMHCPLTSDYRAFETFLDAVDVETISSGTTVLDQAIALALATFKKSGSQAKQPLLLLCTDGEDFSSRLSAVKQDVLQQGLVIAALGIGSEQGAPIPRYDHHGRGIGHQMNQSGEIVITRLNEPLLEQLAHDAGGMYVRARNEDNHDVDRLVHMIQRIEKDKTVEHVVERRQELYSYPLIISLVCLLFEWLL